MCGGDADYIRRLLMYKAQFINGVSLRCVAATLGYVPLVRALGLPSRALTYLFLSRADRLEYGYGALRQPSVTYRLYAPSGYPHAP